MAYNVAANLRQTRPGAAYLDERDNVMRNALAERQVAGNEQLAQFNQNRLMQQDQVTAQERARVEQERAQAGEKDKRTQAFTYLSHLSRAKSEPEFNYLADRMAQTPLFRELQIPREELTPDNVRKSLPMFAAQAGAAPAEPEKPAEYTLGPGQRRFEGGREVASVPAAPSESSMRPVLTDVSLPDGTIQKQWVVPGQGSGQPVGSPRSAESGPTIRDVTTLRKEFENSNAVSNYRAVLPLYNRAVTAPNTRAGDISMIYALGKMFDPTSVVREGELVLAQNAAPWLRKMASQANSQISNRGALNPETRRTILEALKGQVDSFQIPYQQERERYSQYATEYGVDPFKIVGNDANQGYSDQPAGAPKVGEVRKGYRFKGGDPSQQSSWEKVR